MRRIALATAFAAAAVGIGGAAMATDDNATRLNVPATEWKSEAEIKEKLISAGYTVREIESDDGAYEVDVVDKDGVRMELHVHPATGELLRGYDD